MSDLVRPSSTRVLDCYMNEKKDIWTCFLFVWPRVVPLLAACEVWKRFMRLITIGDQFLPCNLLHHRYQSCHCITRSFINSSRTLLKLLCSNQHTFFKLTPATRGDFHFIQTTPMNNLIIKLI